MVDNNDNRPQALQGSWPTLAKPTLARVGVSVVWRTLANSMCACKPRRPARRWGSHKMTPETPKRAIRVGHGHTSTKKTSRESNKSEIGDGRGEKSAKFFGHLILREPTRPVGPPHPRRPGHSASVLTSHKHTHTHTRRQKKDQ